MIPFILLISVLQIYQNRHSFSLLKVARDPALMKLATGAGVTQFLVQILYLLSG
jgi:hypothetical protein